MTKDETIEKLKRVKEILEISAKLRTERYMLERELGIF